MLHLGIEPPLCKASGSQRTKATQYECWGESLHLRSNIDLNVDQSDRLMIQNYVLEAINERGIQTGAADRLQD